MPVPNAITINRTIATWLGWTELVASPGPSLTIPVQLRGLSPGTTRPTAQEISQLRHFETYNTIVPDYTTDNSAWHHVWDKLQHDKLLRLTWWLKLGHAVTGKARMEQYEISIYKANTTAHQRCIALYETLTDQTPKRKYRHAQT